MVKNLPANAGDAEDTGLIPGSGRFLGGGNGNPLQCSCLENPHADQEAALSSFYKDLRVVAHTKTVFSKTLSLNCPNRGERRGSPLPFM